MAIPQNINHGLKTSITDATHLLNIKSKTYWTKTSLIGMLLITHASKKYLDSFAVFVFHIKCILSTNKRFEFEYCLQAKSFVGYLTLSIESPSPTIELYLKNIYLYILNYKIIIIIIIIGILIKNVVIFYPTFYILSSEIDTFKVYRI